MAKIGTQKKQKISGKKALASHLPFERSELKNSKLVSDTLLECIRTEDIDSFRDILSSYIVSTNKVRFAKKTGLGRQTLYDLISPKSSFNPPLSTISAIIRGIAE